MVKTWWHCLTLSLLIAVASFVPATPASAQDTAAAPVRVVDVDDDDDDDEGKWGLAGLLGLLGLAGLLRRDRRHAVPATHVSGTTPVTGTSVPVREPGRDVPRT